MASECGDNQVASGESSCKPRILVIHPALAPYRIDLFNALADQVVLKLVFLNENVPYQDFDQASLLRDLRVDYSYLIRGVRVLGREFRFGVSSEIRKVDPRLVITHEFSPVTFQVSAYGRIKGFPHVVWTADSPEVISSESPLRRVARRMVLKHVDGLVVYSEETKQFYEKEFSFDGPIGICPNVQNEEALRGKLHDAAATSASLVATHELLGKKVLLYVGRLAKVKRIDRLIQAFASTCADAEDSVLVLVGDGPERGALQKMVSSLGIESRVVIAGHCEGHLLYAWFNLGSLFALTSEFEPWGAVVNEALITGIPVICTSRAGARALIAPNVNGVVVDTGNSVALENALTEWLITARSVDAGQLGNPRKSLMVQSFSDAVAGFMSPLNSLLQEEN